MTFNSKKMKNKTLILVFIVTIIGVTLAKAQVPTTQALPDTSQMAYNQISHTGGLVVFPAQNQNKQQQKDDEFACYLWAMEQTGIDPLNLPKVEAEVQTGPTGGAVRGAARGAAAGAAIGAIAGDAGEGAAIGAAAGGMGGFRGGRMAQAQQNQQAQTQADAANEEVKNQFKKAFSVCMEGKGYTVK
jgi:hypothetical protein